ncbi:LysR family transcriptional regulator [Salininema proteolyticum]|uniref:LysR family transcriptional regulator n=1 Tax=Salininema proteolyticum TaxID=1607685 RepID=A0ABV8TXI4_9ACTN
MALSPRVPDLASLELLTTVGSTGGIGAAAAELGISQPSASHRIRTMERLVGVQLLQRTPRGSRLTSSGALLVEWATTVVEAASVLDAGIDALRDQRDAHLAVSASLTIAEYLLPRSLAELRRTRPETTATLTVENSHDVVDAVEGGRADVGFIEGPRAPRGFSTRTIGSDDLVVVVAPGHPWSRRSRPLQPRELAATPLISREAGSGTRAALEKALEKWAAPAEPLLELSSTMAVKAAVAQGGGAAVLSSLAVQAEVESGRLAVVPVEGLDLSRRLRAVWNKGARLRGPAADLLARLTHG